MAKYFNTYFRISAGYVWGRGMNEEKMRLFYNEITLLFVNAGWGIQHVDSFSSCIYVIKGKTKLYVHPMELSGPCEEGLVEKVSALLSEGERWTLTRVDVYDELLDMNRDELMEHYRKEYAGKADSLLREGFRRKRGEKIPISPTLFEIGGRIKVKTLEDHLCRSSMDPDQAFLRERFDSLVERGEIVSDGKFAHLLTDRERSLRKETPALF